MIFVHLCSPYHVHKVSKKEVDLFIAKTQDKYYGYFPLSSVLVPPPSIQAAIDILKRV